MTASHHFSPPALHWAAPKLPSRKIWLMACTVAAAIAIVVALIAVTQVRSTSAAGAAGAGSANDISRVSAAAGGTFVDWVGALCKPGTEPQEHAEIAGADGTLESLCLPVDLTYQNPNARVLIADSPSVSASENALRASAATFPYAAIVKTAHGATAFAGTAPHDLAPLQQFGMTVTKWYPASVG